MRLWTCAADGVWGAAPTEVLEGAHQRTVRRCAFSRCGTMIAAVSFDATASVWDSRFESEWDLLVTLEGHESEVKDAAWSYDNALLATCGRDKTIWVWVKEIDDQFECLDVLQGHTQDVKAIAWIPPAENVSGRTLVSAGYDNTIRVWSEVSDEWIW